MKSNTIIILLIVVLLGAGVYFFVQSKKKGDSIIDNLFDVFKKKQPEKQTASGEYPAKAWMRKELGYGDFFLDSFSNKDSDTVKFYTENYKRKGISLDKTKENPLYNELVRINSYAGIFPELPKVS